MENINFQYPSWYLILCILAGVIYASFLYFRDKTFQERTPVLTWGLAAIRFFSVTALSILLLSPLLKSLSSDVQKPIVILALDESESVKSDMDENDLTAYKQTIQTLSEELSTKYELKTYSFGEEVREGNTFAFTDKVSNISELLNTVYDRHSNQNLGAVILATDGIYNEGSNPLYAGTKLSAPIYTIALGDTTPQRDIVIKRVFHNKIAYLGDKFSIQIDVAAQNCKGVSSKVSVYKIEGKKRKQLDQSSFSIDKDNFFYTQEAILEADKAGVQRYRISVTRVEGEATVANNSKDIFIDVLDARQKILLLANSPHPDLTAIKQTIGSNKNYEVHTAYFNELTENLLDFDFVILHQLPSITKDASILIKRLKTNKIPHLFIVGAQTNLAAVNQLQSLASIQSDGRNINEVQASIAPNFSLFTLSDNVLEKIPQFAPLIAPFGEYTVGANARVLLYQRIGKIDTKYPLLLLGENEGVKTGILYAEGIWKWRLFDFLQHENHAIFEELFGKTIQYLTLKEDKRKFRVSLNKNIFNENEPILLDAELYNENYELINEPDVNIVITSTDGKDFNFVFNKTGKVYSLNAGILPTGNYSFRATTFSNGQNLTYSGQFSVEPIQLEVYETTANHGLLSLLSGKHGGEMLFPSSLNTLPALLEEKGTVKPVVYNTTTTRAVINLKWIFFILLGLLTIEWFFRRYFGGY